MNYFNRGLNERLKIYYFMLKRPSTKLLLLFLKISFIFIYFEKNGIVIELPLIKKMNEKKTLKNN
jgi:hypothetical protein